MLEGVPDLVEVRQAQQNSAVAVVLQGEQMHALGQAVLVCQERDRCASAPQLTGSRRSLSRRTGAAASSGASGGSAKGQDEGVIDLLLQRAPVPRCYGTSLSTACTMHFIMCVACISRCSVGSSAQGH